MKNILTPLLLLMLTLSFRISLATDLNTFFEESDSFLKKHVVAGHVAYKKIKADNSNVQKLYKDINTMNLSNTTDNEKKAFYINAYNIIVIYQVSKYYPLRSALDQSGFFDKVKHVVAGESMTLNFLEIKKLVLTYKDPLLHFALACAAESCPPLASHAYFPADLSNQLENRTKLSLNDNDWIKVDAKTKTVSISKIFDWYKRDFSMTGLSTIQFINKHRKVNIPENYRVEYYTYDWSLNEG